MVDVDYNVTTQFTSLAGGAVPDLNVLARAVDDGLTQALTANTVIYDAAALSGDGRVRFVFGSTLSGPDQTALDAIVAAHTGLEEPLFDGGTQTVTVVSASAPGSTNDEDAGYAVGTTWINTSTNDVYTLVDDTSGAAVWVTGGGGGGISEEQHKTLRQLIHFIAEGPADGFASGAFKEVTGGLFPTSIVWWESAAKLKKIVEKTITRSGGGATLVKPTPIVWEVYDTDGTTVLATVSDAITYSGVAEVSRTRTIT